MGKAVTAGKNVLKCLKLLCSVDVGSGEDKAYQSLTLAELQRVGTLGMGGFGRVELVSDCCCVMYNMHVHLYM